MEELDVDALLEAQSSDEDDIDLSQLGRSIDDILNDAEDDDDDLPALEDTSTVLVSEEQSTTTGTGTNFQDQEQVGVLNTRKRSSQGAHGIAPLLESLNASRSAAFLPGYTTTMVTRRPSPRPGAALAAAVAASRQALNPGKTTSNLRQASTNGSLQLVGEEEAPGSSEPTVDSRAELPLNEPPSQEGNTELASPYVSASEDVTPPEEFFEREEAGHEDGAEEEPYELVNGTENEYRTDTLIRQEKGKDEVLGNDRESEYEAANSDYPDMPSVRQEEDQVLVSDSPSSDGSLVEDETVISMHSSVDTSSSISEDEMETQDAGSLSKASLEFNSVPMDKVFSPLEEAEELESGAANSGLHLEAGAAAQPMQLEGIQRGPPAIGLLQLDWAGRLSFELSSIATMRDHGNPRALAIHNNFIAVGMSKGTVLLAPSKYSATRSADDNDAKIVALNNAADKSQSSVTVLSFNISGELLLAGYANGTVTLWDVTKAVAAKTITGEHAVVVHAAFIGQDFSSVRQMKALTADCKGVVLLHTFTLLPVLRRFSVTTQCLLDGQRGIVLSVSTLVPEEIGTGSTSGGISMTGNDVGRRFLYDGASDETGGYVALVTQQVILVFRFQPSFEICANLPRPTGVREGSIPYVSWRGLRKSDNSDREDSSQDPLLALAWGKKVLILQLQKELQLQKKLKLLVEWDLQTKATGIAWLGEQMLIVSTANAELCLFTKDGIELERSTIRDERGDIEALIFHTYFLESCNNPEKVYTNSTGVRGAAFYFLGPSKLWRARLLPWQERIKALQDAGDWMGAFQIAMELYDGKARCVTGLPTGLGSLQQAIAPNLLSLLSAYLDEAFAYVRWALGKTSSDEEAAQVTREHYARLGGVAIEFCVHIKRTDVLFENVFRKFEAVGQAATFLELLEPYILKDMLAGLAPEIMQCLVEHYSHKGWLQRVEQCILHMDIGSLDFNQVMKLCREHGLFSALIYLFNKGLNDFQSPVEELLTVARDQNRTNAQYFGYKLLVYLKYCFSGLAFPPGRGVLPPEQLPEIQSKLLEYLVDPTTDSGTASIIYPRLHYLLNLDAASALSVLKLPFNNHDIKEDFLQRLIDALVHIVETAFCTSPGLETNMAHILEFIAHFMSTRDTSIPPSTLQRVLEHLSSGKREDLMLAVLKAAPQENWNPEYVLQLSVEAEFWQVNALVHTRRRDYTAALHSHVKDPTRWQETFLYVISMLDSEGGLQPNELSEFQAAVIGNISQLVQLSRDATVFLVLEYFNDRVNDILKTLESFPSSLFHFLKGIIGIHSCRAEPSTVEAEMDGKSKTEPWSDRVHLASLLDRSRFSVTDEMVEFYVELMCQFEPSSVLSFLQNYESYRLEQCLKLCQKYGVKDGAAFLLERVGDVGGALALILEDLTSLIQELDKAFLVRCSSSGSDDQVDTMPEVSAVISIKDVSISLCQRNTFRLDSREAESLWFHLLERFVHPLKSLVSSMQSKPGMSCRYNWRVLSVDAAAVMLRRLFSRLVGDIVIGMVGYIPSHEILNKIISDHGNHEFGDFKETILEMLSSYGYELSILGTAKRIIEADMFHNIVTLRRGRTRALSPKTPACCVCGEDRSEGAIHIFSCGHLAHIDCLEEPAETSRKRSKLIQCPECSTHEPGVSTPASSYATHKEKISREDTYTDDPLIPGSIRNSSASSEISRFELLKSLQSDQGLAGVDVGPRLQLSPPVIRKHPVTAATSSRKPLLTSTNKQQQKHRKRRVSSALLGR